MRVSPQTLIFGAGVSMTVGVTFMTAAPLGSDVSIQKLLALAAPWILTTILLVVTAGSLERADDSAKELFTTDLTPTERAEIQAALRAEVAGSVRLQLILALILVLFGLTLAVLSTKHVRHAAPTSTEQPAGIVPTPTASGPGHSRSAPQAR